MLCVLGEGGYTHLCKGASGGEVSESSSEAGSSLLGRERWEWEWEWEEEEEERGSSEEGEGRWRRERVTGPGRRRGSQTSR